MSNKKKEVENLIKLFQEVRNTFRYPMDKPEIIYIKGQDNLVADFLSRWPIQEKLWRQKRMRKQLSRLLFWQKPSKLKNISKTIHGVL